MERLLIIAFSLSLIVLQINCKPTFNKIPTINSVERLDENTLKLSWTIDHSSETLSRYRILFARDGAGDRLFEWPAQINRIDNDVVGTTYRSSLYKNAFECYKKCVINPMCIFAAFRTFSNKLAQDAQTTCLMKSKLDKSVANGLLTSNTSNNNNIATEYIEIADYQSEAILNGVPTHISYSFSVLVYDRELDDWSEESEIYEYKPPKLDSKLEYEFRNGHVFSWSQPKSGADLFTISRYNLVLWEDDDLNKREKISIKDEIKSFKFNLDYYNDDISPVYAASENECFQLCIEQANCVRYAFSTATNDCHLMGKFDLTNCKLLPKNSVVYSLRRDSNEFRVRNLNPKTSYNAHLEFLTPYGFIGRSNILKFETGEFFNVDEEPEQERETRAPTKQAAVTTKASEEKPPIVEEVDEYFVIPGSGGSSSENEKPEPEIDSEYPGAGGESVIGGGGDNESGETDVDKTTLEINLESSQTKRVNERFEIECTFRGSSKKDIIWTKKGDRFKFLKTEISRSNGDAEKSVTNKLIFDSLTRKDDGTYTCYSEDRPEDSIDLVLNVKNVPSKPVIKKATASEKTGAVIGWELEDNGGLDPIKGIIEISQDFQDSSSLIEGIELNNEDLKQKEVQIDVDANIKKGSFVRLSIENAVGTSEKSDEFRVIDADIPIVPQQEVTEILSPAGIILGVETTSSPLSVESSTPHQNQPSSPAAIKVDTAAATKAAEMIINQKPKAFSFLLMVAAILFLVIIAYAVYRCKFANKSDDNQATAKENEKPEQADENKTLVDNKEEK